MLSDDNYRLAVAYAADRGLPLASIARSALMAEVKRHATRSGLLTAMHEMVKQMIAEHAAGSRLDTNDK